MSAAIVVLTIQQLGVRRVGGGSTAPKPTTAKVLLL
eukprot:COSAG03_NODE_18131_length_361_cov_0.961832_1_plen_35_part_10